MRYHIFGAPMPAVTIELSQGESMYTQSGGMIWMTEGIRMDTNLKGGIGGAFGRAFSGESLFMATYTATEADDKITFASTMPGDIKMFSIRPGYEIIAQKGAFLCAEPGVKLSTHFHKSAKGGLFGGEGFILQKYSGDGTVFCEIDGSLQEIELEANELLRVDTGNIAAFESSVCYSAEMVKGFKNVLFGGEGLFLSTLRGPGKVWIQTMTAAEFARKVLQYMPKSSNSK